MLTATSSWRRLRRHSSACKPLTTIKLQVQAVVLNKSGPGVRRVLFARTAHLDKPNRAEVLRQQLFVRASRQVGHVDGGRRWSRHRAMTNTRHQQRDCVVGIFCHEPANRYTGCVQYRAGWVISLLKVQGEFELGNLATSHDPYQRGRPTASLRQAIKARVKAKP